MDIDADPFLKYLIHRSKNLNKKIDKIKTKKIQQREAEVRLQEEEKKLLASRPTIDTQLSEIDAIQKTYVEFLKSKKPAEPKVENDQSKDLITLWVLFEFLQNDAILSSLDQDTKQQVEEFMEMAGVARGTPGETFENTKVQASLMVEKYLTGSDSPVKEGNLTYSEVSEVVKKLSTNMQMVIRPHTPATFKAELSVEPRESLSGNWKEVEEEEAPFDDPWAEEFVQNVQENVVDNEARQVALEETKGQGEEDDGFVSVSKRQKSKKEPEVKRVNKRGEDSEKRGRRPNQRRGRNNRKD